MSSEKHIVSFSGGKDSTAMLLRMIEENMQIDEIIFCDTGVEFPDMYEHIEKVKNYIQRDITILKNKYSYEYYLLEHLKTKGKNKGKKGLGWSNFRNRWCTGNLKTNVFNKYIKDKYTDCKIIRYIGIAFDEQNRLGNYEYPLIDFKMTEKDCLNYCYNKGFNWNGLYEKFDRVSCYLCPLQRLDELEIIYNSYPKLWNHMKDLDKRSVKVLGWKFRSDYSIEELELKFNKEKEDV